MIVTRVPKHAPAAPSNVSTEGLRTTADDVWRAFLRRALVPADHPAESQGDEDADDGGPDDVFVVIVGIVGRLRWRRRRSRAPGGIAECDHRGRLHWFNDGFRSEGNK